MKVLAINSCPQKDKGNTARFLGPFLDGMRDAGAVVDLVYGRDLMIFPCCGNLNCTIKTSVKCIQFDDMEWLRPKMCQADILVLASPRYCDGAVMPDGFTGPMRALLDKLKTHEQPCIELLEGSPGRIPRENVNLKKIVLVSNQGFLEIDDLDPVLTHVKAFCINSYPELSGTIFQPYYVFLRCGFEEGTSILDIPGSARNAGFLLMQEIKMSVKEDKIVSRELKQGDNSIRTSVVGEESFNDRQKRRG
ncbi:flavodoxin family protein [Methanooceanicella nereidis]|nr:flavodoxin family protein [Methanocella sp. CWC-04]